MILEYVTSVNEKSFLLNSIFQGIWKCVGTKGTTFSEVDLSEEEWTDYDEKVVLLRVTNKLRVLINYSRPLFQLEFRSLVAPGLGHDEQEICICWMLHMIPRRKGHARRTSFMSKAAQ